MESRGAPPQRGPFLGAAAASGSDAASGWAGAPAPSPAAWLHSGFTLVELLVVIAIIAILAAALAPNAFRAVEKAKTAKVGADLKAVKTAALAYYADTGLFPQDDDIYVHQNVPGRRRGIDFLENKTGVPGWDGPYLESWPQNPYWKTQAADPEEGYQWEGTGPTGWVDFDGDGQAEPAVEMGFLGMPDQLIPVICQQIDRAIDDGDLATGDFRINSNGRWAAYRVVYYQ